MEKRSRNVRKVTDKKGNTAPDDCGQIDHIIGSYGKYQFMIYMFKILVGVTSAFNNLGVTFFAPSDFVSYWCADSTTQSLAISSTLNYDPSYPQNDLTLMGAANNQVAPLIHTHAHHHHQLQPFAENHVHNQTGVSLLLPNLQDIEKHHLYEGENPTNSVSQLFGSFIFNSERNQRKLDTNFTTNTPRNLRKECDYLSSLDNKRHKCTSYQYDTGIWMSTIIDEWNLVCDRALYITITQSLYMGGFIVSYLLFGYISDRFGRWRSLLLGCMIEILSGFGCAFAGSVNVFMLCRFLLGLGNAGRSSSSYLMMIEWTGQAWRMHVSVLGTLGWIFGYCIMPWITLYFLHFRHLQMFVCFYEIIFLIWIFCLPESPRWLLTHRRFDDAYKVLLTAAKFNGLIKDGGGITKVSQNDDETSTYSAQQFVQAQQQQLNGSRIVRNSSTMRLSHLNIGNKSTKVNLSDEEDEHEDSSTNDESTVSEHQSLQPYTIDEFNVKFALLKQTICQKEFTTNENRLNVMDLFRWPNLRKYTMILMFVWACNAFVYYGIALGVGDFGGKNLFVSFSFAGLTELPGMAFSILFMKFLPRETTNFCILGTVLLLCLLQVPLKYYELSWLQQITMNMAKLFNSCSYISILYQSMELFPTSIRQTAYSSCSLAGRFGSILAPFIKELSRRTNNLVPPIIYSILCIMEILLIRHLPETRGSDLPDTLLEAEKFKGIDKKKIKSDIEKMPA